MIDEEISRSTIAISVRASKLTARGLAYALGEAARKIRKAQAPQGKQTVLPIAGLVLTFVATYELIQMILEKNNMHEFDVANIYKWVFKTSCAILILTNTFNIVMAVFDVSQSAIASAAGLIRGSTSVTPDMLADLEATLETMDIGSLLGLFMQSILINVTMTALNIIIFVLVYGRMIEIYLLTSLAPIPVATLSNRELGGTGQNYLKSLFAVAFQGMLILVITVPMWR